MFGVYVIRKTLGWLTQPIGRGDLYGSSIALAIRSVDPYDYSQASVNLSEIKSTNYFSQTWAFGSVTIYENYEVKYGKNQSCNRVA